MVSPSQTPPSATHNKASVTQDKATTPQDKVTTPQDGASTAQDKVTAAHDGLPSSHDNLPTSHIGLSPTHKKRSAAREKASAAYNQALDQLTAKVAKDPELVQHLEQTFAAEERVRFTACLQNLLPQESHTAVKDVWCGFSTYCKEHADEIPLRIVVALKKRGQLHSAFKHRRNHFALSVGLVPKAKGLKLANVPTIQLAKKKVAYPPRGHDIYETPEARQTWEDFQAKTPYPDRRGGKTWKPLHELNPENLQHTVKADESVIIRDHSSGELIGVVIRNFSNNNQHLLDWINGIIAENTGARRSVRLEDPGKLCQIGYTSGARSKPELGWARNLLKKEADTTVSRLMYESSSVFALFWNILRNQLPEEVNSDFDSWLQDNQMLRMDTKGSKTTVQGVYTVKCGDDSFAFHGVEMPPPSGVFGTNYSRFIHREGSGHKYAVAWTTMRDPNLGNEWGGHFFICSHGIKVEAATDTVVVWKPRSWHGTSLQQRDPGNPEIFQAGLAIVTPPGIAKLWADFYEKRITLEEARKRALELESAEVDE